MKYYGLIGYPLEHSFSEKYFTQKFKKENISNARYQLFPLPDINRLPQLIQSEEQLLGLNVTIPHKEKVKAFLDELSPDAEAIGAVNTIKITRKNKSIHTKGYNTDVYGFRKALNESGRKFKTALILGSGGAAKAAAHALKKMKIDYRIVSRNNADEKRNYITYNELNGTLIQETVLIVNCTPLGTFPKTDETPPIPYHMLNNRHFLFDMVYNPPETLFMKKGKARGAECTNGLSMLHHQADKAAELFEIFV